MSELTLNAYESDTGMRWLVTDKTEEDAEIFPTLAEAERAASMYDALYPRISPHRVVPVAWSKP